MRLSIAALVFVFAVTSASVRAAPAPSVDIFKQTLQKHLLELTPAGSTERQVLFQQVAAGKPNGGKYPFMVTLVIRDYGPGYPANNFFGATCVGKMDGWKFNLVDDGFGSWIVQGAMTVLNDQGHVCKDNPAAGVSSFPLASLSGTSAHTQVVAPAAALTRAAGVGSLPQLGEYACYGNGTLLAGAGIKLLRGGRYTDVDGQRGGAYNYNSGTATISFAGGFFGGQTGTHVTVSGFDLSRTVSCESES